CSFSSAAIALTSAAADLRVPALGSAVFVVDFFPLTSTFLPADFFGCFLSALDDFSRSRLPPVFFAATTGFTALVDFSGFCWSIFFTIHLKAATYCQVPPGFQCRSLAPILHLLVHPTHRQKPLRRRQNLLRITRPHQLAQTLGVRASHRVLADQYPFHLNLTHLNPIRGSARP